MLQAKSICSVVLSTHCRHVSTSIALWNKNMVIPTHHFEDIGRVPGGVDEIYDERRYAEQKD